MPGIRKVFPSDANFLLIKVDQPDKVYEALMRQGIIVRNRSRAPLCEGCLRVTVGTAEENQALTTALAAILP
jgi:histidinol-phosphate aminotransferase